jgi:hypothetical protein
MPPLPLVPLASAARLMAVAGAISLVLTAEPTLGTPGQKDEPTQAAAPVDLHAVVLSGASAVIDQTIGATRTVPVEFATGHVPVTFVGRQPQEPLIQPIYLHSITVVQPPSRESKDQAAQEKPSHHVSIAVQIPAGVRSREIARIFHQGLTGLASPTELSGVIGSKTMFIEVQPESVSDASMTLRYTILKPGELLPVEQTVAMASQVHRYSCSLAIMDRSRLHQERQSTMVTPLSLVRARPQPVNLVLPPPLPVD